MGLALLCDTYMYCKPIRCIIETLLHVVNLFPYLALYSFLRVCPRRSFRVFSRHRATCTRRSHRKNRTRCVRVQWVHVCVCSVHACTVHVQCTCSSDLLISLFQLNTQEVIVAKQPIGLLFNLSVFPCVA